MVKLRTVTGRILSLDAPPNQTVSQVKTRLATDHHLVASAIRLVYGGGILPDSTRISDLSLSEDSFILLHYSKRRIPTADPSRPSAAAGDPPDFAARVQNLIALGMSSEIAPEALRAANYDLSTAAVLFMDNPRPLESPSSDPEALERLYSSLSPEEAAVIAEGMKLGFPRDEVVYVYAHECHRNAEETRRLLMSML
jgi:hypothetical protein